MSEQTTILADGTETVALEITSVRYDRLINLGNYENEKLGISVQVPDGTDPAQVAAQARAWVDQELVGRRTRQEQANDLEYRVRRLQRQEGEVRGKLAVLEGIWRQAAELLAAHGITPETSPSLQWNWPKLPPESPAAQAARVEDGDDDDDDHEDDDMPFRGRERY